MNSLHRRPRTHQTAGWDRLGSDIESIECLGVLEREVVPPHPPILPEMPRLLAVIIALLLPIQFAWAAASAYCQHESTPQSAHFGHHFHAHEGESGKLGGSKLTPDADCAACHAAHIPAMASELGATDLGASSSLAVASSLRPFASALARAPDRPQWLRLV